MTSRIKAINTSESESPAQVVDALVQQSEYFAEAINNTNADVRKCCVFCLVEIYSILGGDLFQKEFLCKLNASQQKLVDIYIKRKQDE